MQGLEYEHAVADYLSEHGYKNVSVTKGSGDYGVDIIAHKGKRKYAVQCKYYSNPVGLAAVQEAVAGKAMYGCTDAMVVTNSTFTSAAQNLAEANGVILLEKVSVGRFGRMSGLKILLWCAYIFFASAIAYSTYTVVREQELSLAIYNIVCTGVVLTVPFWIKPLLRAVKCGMMWCFNAIRHWLSSRG